MARFIRWQGMAAFFIISALIIVFCYLFAESLAKSAIVSASESAFGAEVNIADVELGFSPLQISVIGMQVTDKEMPAHNLFSFQRATAGVDVWEYLFGKVIIDELTVSQLALSTVREKPGEVYIDDETVEEGESFSDKAKGMLPEVDMELPDVKTLLNDSNLLTVKAATQLQESYKTEQVKIKALKEKLPSKDKLKSYQDKVKALGKMEVKTLADIEKIKTAFDDIKAEFKADQALVKSAKQQVIDSKNLLAQQALDLKSAPGKDWQVIEDKYQLDSLDTEDFAHILFGEAARGYTQKALWAYEQVSPFLGGSDSEEEIVDVKTHAEGRFIYFDEENPLPSVLVKKLFFSILSAEGDIEVTGSELTHQHWYRGKNSLINVSSVSNGEFTLTSQFNLTESGDFNADGEWLINDRTLEDAELTSNNTLSLTLSEAQFDGKGIFNFKNTNVESMNNISLSQASYQGEASSKVTELLLDTVKSLDKLTLDVGITGELDKPNFSIASSLNDALTGAFTQQVAGKLGEFKEKVNKGLNEKLASALKLGDSQTAELLDLEALLTDTDKAFEDLQNSDIVKQQQQKLEDKVKDKAKDKLKGKLGDLFG
ncbi:TIGR03545 family protein [Colwellia echini]|uniref:TIGR03545 family protein n=1 Tax=Colwellia echini TaxID=1982103 RepID=A0ABY3MV34_9GAMM|nr:TIGR03545 family protein [Colwellia echini]TYK65055.1 TIGR03545 family protein [Colwellia echini]